MITFQLELPELSPEKQFQLEEALLKIPHVDALVQDNGDFSITSTNENSVLRNLVAALYGWASDYSDIALQMKVVCSDAGAMVLGKRSPNDIIQFLASC